MVCALAGALLAAASGCGRSDDGEEAAATGGTLKIGASLALTGSLAKEGGLTRQGYEICQEKVNAKGGVKVGDQTLKLAIQFSDDKSEPETAARLIDNYNGDGIKLILGPYGSPSTEAAAAVIERNGQVMLDSSGADDAIFTKGYKNTFAVLSPASRYLATIVKAIAEQADPKPKTVAFLTADDGFSLSSTEGGVAEAKKQGFKVLGTEKFPSKTTDVSAALTKIRAKKPDLILGAVHVEEGIAIIKQSRELGVKPQGFGETVAPPTADFRETLGKAAEGVVGSSQWTAAVAGQDDIFGTAKDYAADFEKKFGAKAQYHSAEAAAACMALVKGVEKAGSTDPVKVRDAVAALDMESFFGRIKFSDTGQNLTKDMSAVQIQDGEVVTIYPADQQQKPLVWPGVKD
jgi:branched-chain amino acid transport system substrate-binding protein